MFESILKAVGNAFRAPPVPTVVPAPKPVAAAPAPNSVTEKKDLSGWEYNPFDVVDVTLNPRNPMHWIDNPFKHF